MSKVFRYEEEEKNKINIPWLVAFVNDLEKKSGGVDSLQQLFQKKEKFNSIEEKMADIKERIGFDLLNKVSEKLDTGDDVKTASKHGCGCGGPKTSCGCKIKNAEYKHPEEDVERMRKILKYIDDMIEKEKDIDTLSVISKCKDEEGLRFGDLRIDVSKLKKFIESKIQSSHKNDEPMSVEYVPQEPLSEGDIVDDIADYYRRSENS